MFTTTDVITALAVGLAVGAVGGMVAWDVLVARSLRVRLSAAERRRRGEAFRADMASQRASAFALLLRYFSGPPVTDDHLGSRRADEAVQ